MRNVASRNGYNRHVPTHHEGFFFVVDRRAAMESHEACLQTEFVQVKSWKSRFRALVYRPSIQVTITTRDNILQRQRHSSVKTFFLVVLFLCAIMAVAFTSLKKGTHTYWIYCRSPAKYFYMVLVNTYWIESVLCVSMFSQFHFRKQDCSECSKCLTVRPITMNNCAQ